MKTYLWSDYRAGICTKCGHKGLVTTPQNECRDCILKGEGK